MKRRRTFRFCFLFFLKKKFLFVNVPLASRKRKPTTVKGAPSASPGPSEGTLLPERAFLPQRGPRFPHGEPTPCSLSSVLWEGAITTVWDRPTKPPTRPLPSGPGPRSPLPSASPARAAVAAAAARAPRWNFPPKRTRGGGGEQRRRRRRERRRSSAIFVPGTHRPTAAPERWRLPENKVAAAGRESEAESVAAPDGSGQREGAAAAGLRRPWRTGR